MIFPVAGCVVSWLEFRIRLTALTSNPEEASEALTIYESLWPRMLPVDRLAVEMAWRLREVVEPRIPLADCLIAGCAKRQGVTLVHRDAHLAAIPVSLLSHITLPGLPSMARTRVREKATSYGIRKRKRKG